MADNQLTLKEFYEQKGVNLLPCPFCGEKEHVYLNYKEGWGYHVHCACGAGTYYEETKPEEAANAWNQRAKFEELEDCKATLHAIEEGSANWEDDYKQSQKQLTTTQQALNSAVEALEVARNFLVVSTGVHRNIVLEKIDAALASISKE